MTRIVSPLNISCRARAPLPPRRLRRRALLACPERPGHQGVSPATISYKIMIRKDLTTKVRFKTNPE